jgi:hypothetical protein
MEELPIEFNFDFGGAEDLEFDITGFDISSDIAPQQDRYINPKISKEATNLKCDYANAEKLVADIKIEKDSRHYFIVSGAFIFGDLIEALAVKNNYNILKLTISTLSLSENNIDSLKGLIMGDYVQELNMIISAYMYSHERDNLIPYMYQELDIDNKFQLAVVGTHCKIALLETECGKKIVIHGSANLRSSANIEQFMIEENEILYDFNMGMHKSIIETYKTINKDKNKLNSSPLRVGKLWRAVAENQPKKQVKLVQKRQRQKSDKEVAKDR